jgi:hypothetical protein
VSAGHGHWTANIAIQRQGPASAAAFATPARPQDGVRPEAGFVVGAIEVDHQHVDQALLGRVDAGQFIADLAIHGIDRLQDALAEVALVSVAQLMGLMAPVDAPDGTAARPSSHPPA